MKNEPQKCSWILKVMLPTLAMWLLLTFHHLAEQLMFSKTHSFSSKSIQTSGNKVQANPSKNPVMGV